MVALNGSSKNAQFNDKKPILNHTKFVSNNETV
jgi:hypothetical protein